MGAEARRTSTEITTRSGGIFWGIVFLVVGVLWLMSSLGIIKADLNLLWPLVIILAGVYLIVTKALR